jgi:hypothetical protein
MSGYTDESIVPHGVLEAGTNFIEKPFTQKRTDKKGARSFGLAPPNLSNPFFVKVRLQRASII